MSKFFYFILKTFKILTTQIFKFRYCDMSKGSLNVEWLCMDSAILLPPTGTPLTGIDFTKRLPCGEVERARRAIRVFFLIRDVVLILNGEVETQLPLTNLQSCVQIDQALDLSIARCVFKPQTLCDHQKYIFVVLICTIFFLIFVYVMHVYFYFLYIACVDFI